MSSQSHGTNAEAVALPRRSSQLVGWFGWYLEWYLRKNFHSLALHRSPPPNLPADVPVVVYVNHASWWDPLIALWLAKHLMPGRLLFAPFDAEALASYPIFEKLGFFGVDQASRRGAAQFLITSRAILANPGTSIWMTPEGRFCDPRDVSVPFRPGLAHLAEDMHRGVLLPLALEYSFWEERRPEILIKFGNPIDCDDDHVLTKAQWNERLHSALRTTQSELATASIARSTAEFQVLLGGREGVGGIYEGMRKIRARITGRNYRAAHSDKLGRS